MKAKLIPETENWPVLYVFIALVLLLVIVKLFLSPKTDLYGKIASILKDELHVEAEDAGETNSSYLFDISISAITQHFDLNEFVQKMSRLGCSVLSTADTDNPSFRKLTIQIPKVRKGVGLTSYLSMGFFVGCIVTGFYNRSVLYNSFTFMETVQNYVKTSP